VWPADGFVVKGCQPWVRIDSLGARPESPVVVLKVAAQAAAVITLELLEIRYPPLQRDALQFQPADPLDHLCMKITKGLLGRGSPFL
jgi:hypothetical protein